MHPSGEFPKTGSSTPPPWSFNLPKAGPEIPFPSRDLPNTQHKPNQQSFSFDDVQLVSAFSDIPAEEYPDSKFFSSTFQIALSLGLQLAKDSVTLMEQLLIHYESYKRDIDFTGESHLIRQVKKASENEQLLPYRNNWFLRELWRR